MPNAKSFATLAFLTLSTSALAIACAHEGPDPKLAPHDTTGTTSGSPTNTASSIPTGPIATNTAPTATGFPTALPTTLPTGLPNLLPPATGTSGGTATAVDPNVAQIAQGPLALLARTEAPSASAAGAPMVGSFQEGQTLEQAITISPGKCYSFVAAGAGPQELEISLVAATPVPGLAPIMGSAKGTGLRTVLGAKDACVKLAIIPVDVPARFIVKATKGGGVVAAQAFVK